MVELEARPRHVVSVTEKIAPLAASVDEVLRDARNSKCRYDVAGACERACSSKVSTSLKPAFFLVKATNYIQYVRAQ